MTKFNSIGVSRYPNGEVHVHYTNDSAQRIKAYMRGKNTDIHFWDLPSDMTKLEASAYAVESLPIKELPDDVQGAIQTEFAEQKAKAQPKAPKATAVKVPKQPKAPKTPKEKKEQEVKSSLDAIQSALSQLAKADDSADDQSIDLEELQTLAGV